jgi:hypothetical protein
MTRPGVSLANETDSARSDLAQPTGVTPHLFAYPSDTAAFARELDCRS